MANDIFGYKRNPKPDAVFSTEESFLTFGTSGDVLGQMVQDWNVRYAQIVQEVFEIGSQALYWVKGRPQGDGALSRIIGPKAGTPGGKAFFPEGAFDICDGGELVVITARSGLCESGGQKVNIEMDGVVVTSVGFTMSVNDVRLIENVAWRFARLDVR